MLVSVVAAAMYPLKCYDCSVYIFAYPATTASYCCCYIITPSRVGRRFILNFLCASIMLRIFNLFIGVNMGACSLSEVHQDERHGHDDELGHIGSDYVNRE